MQDLKHIKGIELKETGMDKDLTQNHKFPMEITALETFNSNKFTILPVFV